MRSDVTWNGGEWQMLLDRDGDWTVTDYAWTVNGTTYPGAWRRHYIPLPAGRENLNGITAIGFKALSDKGTCTVWLDNIRLVQGYEPFVTGGPFHSTGTGLADGRFISFGQHEDGSMRYGLYDPAEGSVIRGILDPMSPHWYRAATLSDGTVCVAWDEEKGYYSFMELPPGGLPRIFRQRSLFEAGGNVNIAAVLPLPDREALLVYRNTWYSDFSGYNQVTMKRIGSYGIFIEEVSATTVKVWNFSGESRTLYLSVDS
jgi:hypothetical protein